MKKIRRSFGSTGTKLALSHGDYSAPFNIGIASEEAAVKGMTVDGAFTTADTKDMIENAIASTGKTECEGEGDQVSPEAT
jgi:hypothetical protein